MINVPYIKQVPYKDKVITTIEYTIFDGQPTLSNSFVLNLIRSFKYREKIFYNQVDLDKWNPMSYLRTVRMWVGFIDDKVIGAYWLSCYNLLNKSGFFNCGMCKDAFDHREYVDMAFTGLKMLLNRDDVQTIYGETSLINKPVLLLAEYFGFKTLGMVPKAHYHADTSTWEDTQMMYINKELLESSEYMKVGGE